MKVHIPPSGSSQFKVSPNQTVGDLISMVAKKRVYNVKVCYRKERKKREKEGGGREEGERREKEKQ
jgi:hypothetical protein